MSKFRKLILLFGCGIICIVASLVTFLGLSRAGALVEDATPIVYTVQNISKPYDGLPLLAEDVKLTEGQLQSGHSAVVSYSGSITEVGEGTSDAIIKIVDEENNDVTRDYSIKVKKGKLTVTPQEISIVLDNCVMEYSGEELICDNYQVTKGALASGHKIVATSTAKITDVNDTLSAKNFNISILDGAGKDVSGNYISTFSIGNNVKITPRRIAIKPRDIDDIYRENFNLKGYEIVSGSLVFGHRLEVLSYVDANGLEVSIKGPVDKMEVRIGEYVIYDSENTNVTENYSVDTTQFGTIELDGEIEVALKNFYKKFDGKDLSEVEAKEFYVEVEPGKFGSNVEIRAEKFNFDISQPGIYYFSNEKGEDDDNPYIEFKVFVNGKESSDYVVKLSNGLPGRIDIEEIEIDTSLKTFEYDFDNTDLSSKFDATKEDWKDYLKVTSKNLPEGYDDLTYDIKSFKFYTFAGEEVTEIIDAGTYLYDVEVVALKDTEELELTINVNKGTLIVNKLDVVVTLKDLDKTSLEDYKFDADKFDDYDVDLPSKAFTLKALDSNLTKFDNNKSGFYAYTVDFSLQYQKDKDSPIEDISLKNYSLTVQQAYITYTRTIVPVTLKDKTIKYGDSVNISTLDSNYFTAEAPKDYSVRYVANSATDLTTNTKAGTYEYTAKFALYDKNNKLVDESRFDFEITKGKFTINQKDLTITFKSNSYEYNGQTITEKYTDANELFNSNGLLLNDLIEFDISSMSKVKDYGTYTIDLNNSKSDYNATLVITNNKGEDVTKCYNIKYNSGTIDINKKKLTLTVNITHTYNGETIKISTDDVSADALVSGDFVDKFTIPDMIYVNDLTKIGGFAQFNSQQVPNATGCEYVIRDASEKNINTNYEVTLKANITYNQRDIKIVVNDRILETDDSTYYGENDGVVQIASGYSLAEGDTANLSWVRIGTTIYYNEPSEGTYDITNGDHYNITGTDDTGKIVILS